MNKDVQMWLANTLQDAFPSIPIYTGETMDNEQERNEHFKGFAQLLWREIRKTSFDSPNFSEYPQLERRMKLLIAQRAYDLVCASCEAIDNKQSDYEARITLEAMIDNVPDFTEWPKTPLTMSALDE